MSQVSGALPTVFVSDMDRAVAFYTDVLGLTLAFRAGDHWASIDAGGGCQIGLHPSGEVSSDGMLKIAHFADPDGNPLYLCEQR